jgi:hypothetical protein
MKFLCFAYGERKAMEALSKDQFERLVAKCREHDAELKKSGKLVEAHSLEWATKSIRPRNGKTVVTDGPYGETKEQVGGLILIEAENIDEAVRIASLHPAAHLGEELGWGIELRPIADGCHQ